MQFVDLFNQKHGDAKIRTRIDIFVVNHISEIMLKYYSKYTQLAITAKCKMDISQWDMSFYLLFLRTE